MRCGLEQVQH
jgi:hypothetical protein